MKSKNQHNKKILGFFLLATLLPFNLYSQNNSTSTISVNLFGMPFNDFSLYYDVTINESKRFGISIGYMISNNWWRGKVDGGTGHNEVDDDKIPIGSYNGPELRLYYEYIRNKGNKIKFLGPEIFFKYLYYDNRLFVDFNSNYFGNAVFFVRSEKTFVTGTELLWGRDFNEGKVFCQIFWGIGFRLKFRRINTINSYYNYSTPSEYFRPIGKKNTTMFIPTINFGFKLGTWIKNKKQTK